MKDLGCCLIDEINMFLSLTFIHRKMSGFDTHRIKKQMQQVFSDDSLLKKTLFYKHYNPHIVKMCAVMGCD